MKTLALALLFVASAAVAAEQTAFGIAGDPAKVSRTIAIDMSDDMRYAYACLTPGHYEAVMKSRVNVGK
jgi:azurin